MDPMGQANMMGGQATMMGGQGNNFLGTLQALLQQNGMRSEKQDPLELLRMLRGGAGTGQLARQGNTGLGVNAQWQGKNSSGSINLDIMKLIDMLGGGGDGGAGIHGINGGTIPIGQDPYGIVDQYGLRPDTNYQSGSY